jgi:hypothetical protein
MSAIRLVAVLVLASLVIGAPAAAAEQVVPLRGSWTGLTVAADLSNFPVVAVLSEGVGPVSHLGISTMISPHTSDVFTGETIGYQIFTAANGDTLTAYCDGFPVPQSDGSVVGSLNCTLVSGTGRFAGATGAYEFYFVAIPRSDGGIGFATDAEINGWISIVGRGKNE